MKLKSMAMKYLKAAPTCLKILKAPSVNLGGKQVSETDGWHEEI